MKRGNVFPAGLLRIPSDLTLPARRKIVTAT